MIRIIESKYITSAVKPSSYPETLWKEFAFVGRSNVGKSSMINTITSRKLLAKIANKPGKTRLINFFEIVYMGKFGVRSSEFGVEDNTTTQDSKEELQVTSYKFQEDAPPLPPPSFFIGGAERASQLTTQDLNKGYFTLVDLPGYGYARVSKTEREQWKQMIQNYLQYRKQLAGIVVLLDIRHEIDAKDLVMIRMLQDLKINFMIAATKSDKIPKNKIIGQLKKFEKEIIGFPPPTPPINVGGNSPSINVEVNSPNIYGGGRGGKVVNNLRNTYITDFSSLKKTGIQNILNWIEASIFATETTIPSGRVIIHDKEGSDA